jgi:hypothetical protein
METELMEIDEIIYKKLGKLLYDFIPEYRSLYVAENDKSEWVANYSFMNEFAIKLANELDRDELSVFVNNSFIFINFLSETNNLEILNILKVGILEILYTSGITIREKAMKKMNDKNKMLFSKFSEFYF